MAKILVFATNKGGDGKTTTSVNLAEYAGLILKKRTLLIDVDPQANFSSRYINMEHDPAYQGGKVPPIHPDYEPDKDLDWDGRSSIANVFYGEEVVPYPTDIPNMEILPAHSHKLQEAEAVTKNEVATKVHLQLKKFIELSDVQAAYDLIIIDTPPSKGPLTIAAIKAATHVVIPSKMEQYSIEGIYGMMQLWKQESYARSETNPINLIGVLPNQISNINLHKAFHDNLLATEGIKDYIIPHKIKKRAIYAEILAEGASPKSVFELPDNHIARQELTRACEHIMRSIF